jgi:hypothetical protein
MPGSVVQGLASLAENILVHGFQPSDRHRATLRELSGGSLTGIEATAGAHSTFHVEAGHREWSGPFAGLSLAETDPSRDRIFLEGGEADSHDTIIRVGGSPFFVSIPGGPSQIFLVACAEIADLAETVRRGQGPLGWFSRLVPLMMFLRGVLGNRLWHNERPRACFIIDDPLLKHRYGFLEYRRLLDMMRRQGFSACIAFIPWNYRRTSGETAKLVAANYSLPFVCVHGCDHTRAEFLPTDFELLRGKAQLALERMRIHQQLSGVPFDDVMVFPQCRFSAEAVHALKAANYLAGVNGAVCPTTMPESLTLREHLDVAVTLFANFPLFGRRYPRNVGEFAFDLFMGKPALAVEHHGYFQNGYEPLETFIGALSQLDRNLQWTNLSAICSSASLTRIAKNGDIHVRFYTDRFHLENDSTERRQYVLFRRQPTDAAMPRVSVNAIECTTTCEGDDVQIRVALDPGQTFDVTLQSTTPVASAKVPVPSDLRNAKVLIRRLLCEFRDNYVDTTGMLRGIVDTARNVRLRIKASVA